MRAQRAKRAFFANWCLFWLYKKLTMFVLFVLFPRHVAVCKVNLVSFYLLECGCFFLLHFLLALLFGCGCSLSKPYISLLTHVSLLLSFNFF